MDFKLYTLRNKWWFSGLKMPAFLFFCNIDYKQISSFCIFNVVCCSSFFRLNNRCKYYSYQPNGDYAFVYIPSNIHEKYRQLCLLPSLCVRISLGCENSNYQSWTNTEEPKWVWYVGSLSLNQMRSVLRECQTLMFHLHRNIDIHFLLNQ